MTSSLVGSEMCIRDRISRLVALLTILPPSALKWTSSPAFVRVETASSGPVSYTHLTLPTICSV
eukprot:1858501-Prorocentrum_lima.AAC.1